MKPFRRFAVVAPLLALTGLAALPAVAKDPVGVYAVIDRVVFEPDADNPERVQLWGVFRVSDTFGIEDGKLNRIDLGRFHPATRGYMYFSINPREPGTTLEEWRGLALHAGEGRAVAFGARVPREGEAMRIGGAPVTESALRDTAAIGALIRYNGRVRQADDPVVEPDVYPLRMAHAVPSVLALESLPVVRQLVALAAEAGPSGGSSNR